MDLKRTSLRDLLEIFYRRRRIVQIFFSVVLISTFLATLSMPSVHEASTTILIELLDKSPFFNNPFASELMLEWVKGQAEVIKSHSLLGEVVDDLGLDKELKEKYLEKQLAKKSTNKTLSYVASGINLAIPSLVIPKNITKKIFSDDSEERTDEYFRQSAIKSLQRSIQVAPLEETGIIKINKSLMIFG